MRILISTGLNFGAAEYKNIGDIAMLQAAVSRLGGLWPGAWIGILTDSAPDLARFCPGAQAVSRLGAEAWVNDGILLGGLHRKLPRALSAMLSDSKHEVGGRFPNLLCAALRARFRLRDSGQRLPELEKFLAALRSCELLLVCGAGGFADSCREWNDYTLGLIEAALAYGKKVALLGQGLGPITDRSVLRRMSKVLPRVDLLCSRGTHGARAIAEQCGVRSNLFHTTGDEALEPAYDFRPRLLGYSIGVNLRVAPYSGVSVKQADAVGEVLLKAAERRGADLLPLPIATHPYADDRESISRMLRQKMTVGSMRSLDSPEGIYAQLAQCRMVVTGAYHAAIFALAQGIPAVCIAGSDYYAAKFAGLQELFSEGCSVIKLDEEFAIDRLASSIERVWEDAERLRPLVLNATRSQIAARREAYLALRDLFPQHQVPAAGLATSPVAHSH